MYGSGLVSNSWYSSRFCEETTEDKPAPDVPAAEGRQADPPEPKAKVQTPRRKKKQDTQETAAE